VRYFCLAVALLVACGGRETPPSNSVDLAVVGQTVTKVRTAGNEVVVLEERLTSIFENGPQRTLSILQSDGRTVGSYMPPRGWSVVDAPAGADSPFRCSSHIGAALRLSAKFSSVTSPVTTNEDRGERRLFLIEAQAVRGLCLTRRDDTPTIKVELG
jgi:hypothetical protein